MADVITADTLVTLVTSTASSILGGGSTVKVTAGAGSGSVDAGNDGKGHVHIEPKNDEMMAAMLSTAQRMHYGASAVVGPIFVILGLMGNILSIIIWNRPHMTSSTGRYLTALAIADSGVLVWFILVDTLQMVNPELAYSPAYAVFFSYLGYPIFFFWVVCSIWFMVGVTVDRFIMVVLLTKAKEYCNEKRANVGIWLISGLCFLINVPHFWSFTVDWDQGPNGTGPALVKTEFQKGESGIFYEFWVHCIFLVLVPWFSVFTLNLLIISKISRMNRKMSEKKTKESASKSRQSENQVTRVLLIVTFTFLVLVGFQCISQCFYMLMPKEFDKRIIDEAFAVAKLGVIVNSSINFALYCVSGHRFRQELLRLLGCQRFQHTLFTSSGDGHSSSSGTGTTGM